MNTLSDLSGYVASFLVLATFMTKDMRRLRTIAIFSNVAFIIYGAFNGLLPVFCLHVVLLPLNIHRLMEVVGSPSFLRTASAPRLFGTHA
jgi:hypothetical protein